MSKFLQTLNFRRIFLLVDTICQILLTLLIILVIFGTISSTYSSFGFGGVITILLSFIYFGIQFVSILLQSLVQKELKQVRWIYFPILFFTLSAGAVLTIALSKFLIWLVFCFIIQAVYLSLNIYHCFLLFKKSN